MKESTDQMNQRVKSAIWQTRENTLVQQKTPNHNSKNKKKKKEEGKNEDNLRALWGNRKHNNIHIREVSEGEERQQVIKNLFKEMPEKFPNLGMEKT